MLKTMISDYHIPVLLNAVVEGLRIKPDGVYVDVTFGGGGHSAEILKRLDTGKLIAFDQDEDAEENAPDHPNLIFVRQNFSFFRNYLKLHGFPKVDGILADLGVSSHQFDVAERGFTLRDPSAPLDMRMNRGAEKDAASILNTYEEEELKRVFRDFAEFRAAGRLARAIVQRRVSKPFKRTEDLLEVIEPFNKRKERQLEARVFQALRIEVNDELNVLEKLLNDGAEALQPEGRFVVIAYHSLEDRLVKRFFRTGNVKGELKKDLYGNVLKPLDEVTRKPIMPDEDEIEKNPRARSARLRIAERRNEPN